jgi:hypothetical protein
VILIGLDGWNLHVNSLLDRENYTITSNPHSFLVLTCGETVNFDFFDVLSIKLSLAQKLTGDLRSAAGKRQGHQKTPSFIESLIYDCLSEENRNPKKHLPKGGFTDVGKHTGGNERDTVVSLIQAGLQYEFNDGDLFEKTLLTLHIGILENLMDSKSHVEIFTLREICHHICEKIGLGILRLDQSASYFKGFLTRFERGVAKLKSAVNTTQTEKQKQYSLSEKDEFSLPRSNLPSRTEYLELLYKHDALNSSIYTSHYSKVLARYFEFERPIEHFGIQEFRNWLRKTVKRLKTRNLAPAVIYSVEDFVYQKINLVKKDAVVDLTDDDFSALQDIAKDYCQTIDNWRERDSNLSALKSNFLSSKIIITWFLTCLLHKHLCQEYPLLNDFNFPLDAEILRYVTVFNRKLCKIYNTVVDYIRSQKKNKQMAFSGLDLNGNFNFAFEFARKSKEMVQIYKMELAAAAERTKNRWYNILEKQRLYKSLKAEHDDLVKKMDSLNGGTSRERSLIEGKINNIGQILQNTRQAPAPITNPLPNEEYWAMVVIFFLFIPSKFRIFQHVVYFGQSTLLPTDPWNQSLPEALSSIIQYSGDYVCWSTYYRSNGGLFDVFGDDILIGLLLRTPTKLGSVNVDHIKSVFIE